MWLGAANCKEELNMSNVKSAYKKLGKNSFYDGMITSTTFFRLACKSYCMANE